MIPLARAALVALAASVALAPTPAAAHETLHEVRRGEAIAVRAYFADGEALAYAAFEVFSPRDPAIPHLKGRTDRNGWLAFVPDAPGAWRVRVVEDGGHGLDLAVDAGAPATATTQPSPGPGGAAFILRPLVGLAAIGAVFAVLYFTQRRKDRSS